MIYINIFLIGKAVEDIASSEYLVKYHKIDASPAPYFNLDEEFKQDQFYTYLVLTEQMFQKDLKINWISYPVNTRN